MFIIKTYSDIVMLCKSLSKSLRTGVFFLSIFNYENSTHPLRLMDKSLPQNPHVYAVYVITNWRIREKQNEEFHEKIA